MAVKLSAGVYNTHHTRTMNIVHRVVVWVAALLHIQYRIYDRMLIVKSVPSSDYSPICRGKMLVFSDEYLYKYFVKGTRKLH